MFTVDRPSALLRVGNLDLAGNNLTAAALRVLLGDLTTAGVRELDLSYNDLGDEGVEVLALSPVVMGLRLLRLTGNNIRSPKENSEKSRQSQITKNREKRSVVCSQIF